MHIMAICDKYNKFCGSALFVIFRIGIGTLFAAHGFTKLLSGASGLMLFAGILEAFVGSFLVLGIFARAVSKLGAIEMIFAYFMAHFSGGLSPLNNGGETAVLFFLAFLILSYQGSGSLSLEKAIWKKELF